MGQEIALKAVASDQDNDQILFDWQSGAAGDFANSGSASTTWRAPFNLGKIRIACRITDMVKQTALSSYQYVTAEHEIEVKALPIGTAVFSNGLVTGTVTDAITDKPIEGAAIGIAGTDRTTASDMNGTFSFPDVAPGNIYLIISRDGYVSITIGPLGVK